MSSDDSWMDWDAGPVARPYTVTGGRTRPRGERCFDLVDVVARTSLSAETGAVRPERAQILELCRTPVTVADVASATGLPLGVVRVLLGDLVAERLVEVRTRAPRGRITDRGLLQQVLNGLQALLSSVSTTSFNYNIQNLEGRPGQLLRAAGPAGRQQYHVAARGLQVGHLTVRASRPVGDRLTSPVNYL
jgi:hypothetical protein